MLQSGRLEKLMKQALSYQLDSCLYHNRDMDNLSLLSNYACSSDVIPTKCIATLTKHTDQVWFVQFCNVSGELMASVC